MTDGAFAELKDLATGGETPRVWSLLVTLFGDLVLPSAEPISGSEINALLLLAGLKREAIRVAIHRLRKDGWIDSTRQGRESLYELSAWGTAQTRAAAPRVYADSALATEAWVWIAEPGDAGALSGAQVPLGPNMALASAVPEGESGVYPVPVPATAPPPAWMRGAVCSPDQVALWADLDLRLQGLASGLARAPALGPQERVILRCMVVHAWRRLALRVPALPDHVFPEDWAGPQARARFHDVLHRLPRSSYAAFRAGQVGSAVPS